MNASPLPLAIDGGEPAFPSGPPPWPPSDPAILDALQRCYHDSSWGQYHGTSVAALEAALAAAHELPFAWTCCSGTFAVELALRALKIGTGDEVLLAGYDFPGNFRAVEAVGARPVLVEINPATWCLDARTVEEAIEPATRAILVSHLHGGLADMRRLREIADNRELQLIEDACQCPGARVQGRPAGSWGDIGVLSFGGSKLLSAGRGGAIVTRHEAAYQRAKIYCERGNDAFPLSELQAAVLLPQLEQLAEWNQRRAANVRQLLAECGDRDQLVPVRVNPELGSPAYYKLAWLVRESAAFSADEFSRACRAEGLAIDRGFRGFLKRGPRRCRRAGNLLHCQAAADRTLLLHHPMLLASTETVQRAGAVLARVVNALTRKRN